MPSVNPVLPQFQLVAMGIVTDDGPPFHWACTVAPNGVQPITAIHRPGTGQWHFYFNRNAFSGPPRIFITSAGISGAIPSRAMATVPSIDNSGCVVITTTSPGRLLNTNFTFLLAEFLGPLATNEGVENEA